MSTHIVETSTVIHHTVTLAEPISLITGIRPGIGDLVDHDGQPMRNDDGTPMKLSWDACDDCAESMVLQIHDHVPQDPTIILHAPSRTITTSLPEHARRSQFRLPAQLEAIARAVLAG